MNLNPAENFPPGPWGFRSYRQRLERRFPGLAIRKLCLNAGFTCPNIDGKVAKGGCTYCNNDGFVPSTAEPGDLLNQWEKGRRYLMHRYRRIDGLLAYFQAFSNTYAELPRLRSLYDPLPDAFPLCVGASISTRPDCLSPEIADYLDSLGRRFFLTLEIGLQSDRDETLRLVNRGHDFATFVRAMELVGGRSFEICVHFILGMPGEGEDAPERLGRYAATLPVQSFKMHNLHAMRGTVLAKQCSSGRYQPIGEEEYLDGLCRFIRELRPDQCMQRVLADAPDRLLQGSEWCHDKQRFLSRLKSRLEGRG